MKNIVGVLVCITVVLLASCVQSTATPAPTATPGPTATAVPSATPEPTATPGPVVVGTVTSAEELAGVWHRTTRTGMGMDCYRQYTEDGIYRMGTSPEELEARPRVEGKFWFEGVRIVVQDTSGIPGFDVCVEGEKTGKYEVELLENGHIRFVAVEDECRDRMRMLGSGEMEPIP
jgi:hypothetical protein